MKSGFYVIAVLGALSASVALAEKSSSVSFGTVPAGEAVSEFYRLSVDDQSVPVLACRVSAAPFNQVWPGYQRPVDQTELAGFASWDMSKPVQVEIQSLRPVKSVVVQPALLGIKPAVDGDRIRFTISRPSPVVVEVNGRHHALHLFANPPAAAPDPKTPGMRYFGPGVHHAGRIELKSNGSVYIAAGAVVYGYIEAKDATNVCIGGRGVLDASDLETDKKVGKGGKTVPPRFSCIRLFGCSDVKVDGIVLRNPGAWCFGVFGCNRVDIANVKLVGLWRYNADGIDVCNSQDVLVHDCFLRTFDDALVVKGLPGAYRDRAVRNLRFTRCVIWCDWGCSMEIGAETVAPEIRDIQFDNCDIIRTTDIAMRINHGDHAAVHAIRYENIRIEIDAANPKPRLQKKPGEAYPGNDQERHLPALMGMSIYKTMWTKTDVRGTIADVHFKDIQVFCERQPSSALRGFDAEHGVDGVTIENLRFNGRPVSNAADAHLTIGPHVKNVRFSAKD